MRRSSIALIVIAALTIAVVVLVRANDDTPGLSASPTTMTPITAAGTTTTTATTTTTFPQGIVVPAGSTVCELYGEVTAEGTIGNPALVEASGLAVSRTTEGVLWSHNDSRDGPRLYAFGIDGTDLGIFDLPGSFAFDWEDMAAGPDADGEGSFLYVGDIGDNFDIRDGIVALHRVEDLDPTSLDGRFPSSEPLAFEYPDGVHNAEAFFIDPIDPAVYIITKDREEARVYRGALRVGEPRTVLEPVITLRLGAEVSGADMSPDGSLIAMRGYRTVWMWHRARGSTVADTLSREPCEAPSPDERQGEAITIDADHTYFTVSEGATPVIYAVRIKE
ncbi:MAG: hypothetical protein R2823_04210 [Acidimicrobiia bacterium]